MLFACFIIEHTRWEGINTPLSRLMRYVDYLPQLPHLQSMCLGIDHGLCAPCSCLRKALLRWHVLLLALVPLNGHRWSHRKLPKVVQGLHASTYARLDPCTRRYGYTPKTQLIQGPWTLSTKASAVFFRTCEIGRFRFGVAASQDRWSRHARAF
jgi:hypothetical protein